MLLYFQGDVCIETVDELPAAITVRSQDADAPHILALGELTGHSHAVYGDVKFGRENLGRLDELADLYLGHMLVGKAGAIVRHEEHAPIALSEGVYRVRRQREFDENSAKRSNSRLVND